MEEKRYSYYVVGDYDIFGKVKDCLICICGADKAHAEKVCEEVKANPPKDCLGNIRVEKEERSKCWWNDGSLG